jgi:cytochrome c oxidase assembly protein subunit 15
VTSASTPTAPLLDRLRPVWRDRAVVANLVAQIVIVVTGGAVRLTGSGLGCSSWPSCEPGQFIPELHPDTSYHAFVEYGNRALTVVLVVLAAAVALLAGLDRTRTQGYRILAWVPVVGVVVQALVGMLAVVRELPPAVVGSHMAISLVLIAVSAWLWVRSREGDGPPAWLIDGFVRSLAAVLVLAGAVLLALGIVTTGAGPHSGDDEVGYRFAVDPYVMSRVHAAAVWVFVALLALVLYRLQRLAMNAPAPVPEPGYERADGEHQVVRGVAPVPPAAPDHAVPLRAGYRLLGVTLLQGAVGYVQVATGLPIWLVNLHMLGAALLVAFLALFVGTLRLRGHAPVRAIGVQEADLPDAAAA